MDFRQYTACKEVVERLFLVGPYGEGQAVLEAVHAEGFRTVRSGPYTDAKMHPKLDMTRFLFVVERVSESKP